MRSGKTLFDHSKNSSTGNCSAPHSIRNARDFAGYWPYKVVRLIYIALLTLLVVACSGSGDSSNGSADSENENPTQNPMSPQPTPSSCSCVTLQYICTPGQGCLPFHFCSGCGGPPANTPPVAVASGPIEWSLGRGAITLDGSLSSDANGDTLHYDWLIASAPPGSRATLVNSDNAVSQLTPDQFGRYIVTLVVNDGEDESNTAYAFIDVESAQFATAETTATREVTNIGVTAGYRSATLLDANEDGLNDIIMGSCDDRFSVLLRGSSGWTLSQIVTTNNLGFCHDVTTVGDFNNDGHQDIAIGREIFTGDGAGQFAFWVLLEENDFVSGLATGDFNSDGKDDIAIALNAAKTLRIAFGGASLPLRTSATLSNPLGLGVIAIEESNSEPSDFAFYSSRFDDEGRSEISIVQGNATESYTPVMTELPGFGSIGSGDLNGDGNADIVLSIYAGTIVIDTDNTTKRIDTDVRIATLLGKGDGTFNSATFDGAVDHATGGITITDINRDGFQDVLLLGASPVRISVLLGDGNGDYSSLTVLPELPFGIPTAGDADGDGRVDVIIATGTSTGFWVVWGSDLPF